LERTVDQLNSPQQKKGTNMGKSEELSLLERKRIAPPEECERITRLSWQTLKRLYKDKIVYISQRRPGIPVEDLLKIVGG
jgi:hypothetical protein